MPLKPMNKINSTNEVELELKQLPEMNGKPKFEILVKSILNFASSFGHKLLCDSLTFSLGSACAGTCAYCYVESIVRKHPEVIKLKERLERLSLKFHDVVIVRCDALNILREQLTVKKPRDVSLSEKKVIFTSPLVDPALNPSLAKQTAEACRIILELTNWDIRILSKGNFLRIIAEAIPRKFWPRLIFGHSTGIIDNRLAQAIEQDTALVSKRLEDHYWLQDNGFRTFGMICPILPQENPDAYIREAVEKIRGDRCEHVWAEVLNVRGESMERTCKALKDFPDDAARIRQISRRGGEEWEAYARAIFEACAQYIPANKLRFLQYPDVETMKWWAERRVHGAVLLGKLAERAGLIGLPAS